MKAASDDEPVSCIRDPNVQAPTESSRYSGQYQVTTSRATVAGFVTKAAARRVVSSLHADSIIESTMGWSAGA